MISLPEMAGFLVLVVVVYYVNILKYNKKPFDSVKIIQCKINEAKDNTFTLLAKYNVISNIEN